MRIITTIAAAAVLALPQAVQAQNANPITGSVKGLYEIVKGNVVKAADQMPEEHYAFKPTPEVRSFGQLIGHIADANYAFCTAAGGEKREGDSVEKTKTTKADLVKALGESFAYCDKVYGAMTDAEGAKMASFFGREQAKLGILAFNNAHDYEHYGNIVTYMRMKGLVPPSSQTSSN